MGGTVTHTAPGLVLHTPTLGEVTTLTVSGELDLQTAPQLRDAAYHLLSDGAKYLHLDMSGVTFMDITGLDVLLATKRRAEVAGIRLVLFRSSRSVERLLEVTELTDVFARDSDGDATATT